MNTTRRSLNVSTSCSVFPLTCRIHCLGRLNRHNASIFLVLIFVPVWSHAAENRSNVCWKPCWEDSHIQYQFFRKKQTVHPAVPNSYTLVDASVTVYTLRRDKGSPNLGYDHISYCTTVRGVDVLRNVFFFGICYILPNQHIFRKHIIFSLLAKCILRPGETASQVEFGSFSNTNACDLTRIQSFEQEYSYLTASKKHSLTPCSCNTPKAFQEGTWPYA